MDIDTSKDTASEAARKLLGVKKKLPSPSELKTIGNRITKFDEQYISADDFPVGTLLLSDWNGRSYLIYILSESLLVSIAVSKAIHYHWAGSKKAIHPHQGTRWYSKRTWILPTPNDTLSFINWSNENPLEVKE